MTEKSYEKLEKGDVVLRLNKNGTSILAICTQGYVVYDRQGGEGPILVFENGSHHQYPYCAVSPIAPVLVIANLDRVEENPIRQLLVWRQQFET